jgi:hypothetical protein
VDARESVISSIFFNEDANVLPQILLDSMNGIHFIRRVLLSTSLSAEVQSRLLERIQMAAQTQPELRSNQGYRRLLEEFSTSVTPLSMPPQISQERDEEVVSPLAPRSHTFR